MKAYYFSLDDLDRAADFILRHSSSKILLFYGKMGAGKTTLIKALVKKLGSTDPVTSPTFSLVNEYAGQEGPLYHFDFYRIEDPLEALDIGIEEYFESEAWIFVEWPEKISDFLPEKAQIIRLERIKANENRLILEE